MDTRTEFKINTLEDENNELIKKLKNAIVKYVNIKAGNHFEIQKPYGPSLMNSDHLPQHRKMDLAKLDGLFKDFQIAPGLSEKVYSYLLTIKTGVNFGFFRMGGNSVLRSLLYPLLRDHNPLLFLNEQQRGSPVARAYENSIAKYNNLRSHFFRIVEIQAEQRTWQLEAERNKEMLDRAEKQQAIIQQNKDYLEQLEELLVNNQSQMTGLQNALTGNLEKCELLAAKLQDVNVENSDLLKQLEEARGQFEALKTRVKSLPVGDHIVGVDIKTLCGSTEKKALNYGSIQLDDLRPRAIEAEIRKPLMK